MPLLEIDGPRFGPASGGTPDSLIVLLHGVGADGNDLIELAPILGEHLPGTAFVSPHAPFPYDGAPMGRQWFSLMERTQEMMLAGVRASAPILDAFLDEELARLGLADDRLALVGFSQGTMMSLYVAPRRTKPIAGVVGFSGALVGADLLAGEVKSRPPVLLIHGDADPVVPVQAMEHARRALAAAGIAVEAERRPGLPHSIDQPGLVRALNFLRARFAAKP
jgi:phospholipase/carboxylesterase